MNSTVQFKQALYSPRASSWLGIIWVDVEGDEAVERECAQAVSSQNDSSSQPLPIGIPLR
jgi:hypothetical protein